jgi:ABC-type sugar transport system ATPase subunit
MLTGAGVSVRAGEVVGLAGLLGSGAREILQHFFGLAGGLAKACLATSQPRALRNPKQAMRAGIGLVPGERAQGLVMQQSVRDNIALPNLSRLGRPWWIRPNAGDRLARELIEILDIRPKDPSLLVTALSGGNQQKVIFAKWLACNVNVLLLDEPTHGVDILSKLRIHDLIRDFVRKGGAALMHSTDADELLALSNAILSIKDGHISRRLEQDVGLDAQILRETIGA